MRQLSIAHLHYNQKFLGLEGTLVRKLLQTDEFV